MENAVKSVLSKSNPYYLDKYRYLELKNFCLQYPLWKKAKSVINPVHSTSFNSIYVKHSQKSDPTERYVEIDLYFDKKIKMVEEAAYEADCLLGKYLVEGVTKGVPYTYLRTYLDIPCCRDTYYECYRRFFWILSKKRD